VEEEVESSAIDSSEKEIKGEGEENHV